MPKAFLMNRHAVKVYPIYGTPWYEATYQAWTTTKANTFVCPSDHHGNALRSTTAQGMVHLLRARYGNRFQVARTIVNNGRDYMVGYLLPPGVWEVPVRCPRVNPLGGA